MLELSNPRIPGLPPVQVNALADTGSVFLCIPEGTRQALQLEVSGMKEVQLADGTRKSYPYVGPIKLCFKNRCGFVGAIVLGDQVLLGAIPMEDLDLVVLPRNNTVDLNPASPDAARALVCQTASFASP